MKAAVELDDATFREASTLAAGRGMTLEQFVADAVQEQLRRYSRDANIRDKESPWMAGFAGLADLKNENRCVLRMIEEEFEGPDS